MNTRSVPRMRGQSALDFDARWRVARATSAQETETASTRDPRSFWQPVWLGDMLTADKNSFGVLRLAMALAVLVSHAVFLTTGDVTREPLYTWTGYSLGQHGVQLFFILSGVLVAQSLFQSRSIKDYAIARGLRIFPALAVCVLLTALVLGPLLSALSVTTYLQGKWTALYILKTLSLSTGDATLPGLFVNNVVADKVNTSIWTLKYEVACYALLALVGLVVLRLQAWRQAALIIGGVWLVLALAVPSGISASQGARSTLQVLHYFTIFFGSGVIAYALRDYIPVHGLLLVPLGVVCWLALGTRFAVPALALCLGYSTLWLATFRFGGLRAFTNANDYSYAVYLYHYPVAQALLHLAPDMHIGPLIGFTAGITLLLALLSWAFIERPALALRKRFRAAAATTDPTRETAEIDPPPAAAREPDQTVVSPARSDMREASTAESDTRTTAEQARVWRPMPTRRTLAVMPEAPLISGSSEQVVETSAAKVAAPGIMTSSRDETAADARQPEPEEQSPGIPQSRFVMATQRPKAPAPVVDDEPFVAAPREPSRAVVAVSDETRVTHRSRPLGQSWPRPNKKAVPV